MTKPLVADPAKEDPLARAIAACQDDPLRFVETIFPWGEGALADDPGPDDWQRELLGAVRDGLAAGDNPLRLAVASGHGVGKTALSAWLILWFMSTRDHPQVVVTANPLASVVQVRILPPAPSCRCQLLPANIDLTNRGTP